jgi:hypothetical protein
MTSDELRSIVVYEVENKIITISELAKAISRSPTYISLWLHDKATWNTDKLEALLKVFYRNKSLSLKDQILMDRILEMTNNADNPKALIEAVTTSLG